MGRKVQLPGRCSKLEGVSSTDVETGVERSKERDRIEKTEISDVGSVATIVTR